ncbi:hypothetical protein [Micromonospora sp. URMC 103]|uniref:hypothetical protein n=1 Tax=Micromonospora sp. URMC 103 TaxID=3423406 RepID=UPI003F1D161A
MWMVRVGQTMLEDPSDEQVLSAVQEAVSAGEGEIWIEHQRGPILGLVLGGARAMVLRLEEPGDAGFHAIDPKASREPSGEYVLANRQVDQYGDRDAADARHVVPIVVHFLATTDRWPGVAWQDDDEV